MLRKVITSSSMSCWCPVATQKMMEKMRTKSATITVSALIVLLEELLN